ncbi:MAG: SDR family oxidoreductase [Betaproteobacteria bacterium AqS2]|uniref:SDR family oxidoreductase n=1 Tax=Candidatus Amphirhobacter heronislandensis TaxID=1732024 RepID=A0A930UCT4_9GAMM|nr:SDR family oxidoreductase [Betaproteobacteria bacterium AqS2]
MKEHEVLSLATPGHVAVVTGGAQGIGLAVARQLRSQGARVAIWDVDAKRMEEAAAELGGDAIAIKADVARFEDVERAAAATLEQAGRIHILINNAGISGLNELTVDYPLEEWHRIIDIDLHGVFYCCKAVIPHMDAANYGRVVSIASIAGKEGNPQAAAYSAAKAGVIALTKSLGKEYASRDIAVNCVTPCAARTAIFAQMTEEHQRMMLEKIPRGRYVNPAEIASLVGWLASPANSCATGAAFDISGGRATY